MAVDLLNARTLKLPASLRALPAVLRLATITGACAASAALPNAHAQSPEVREYQIKAAFIYNFLKFVDWPRDALPDGSETINICVLRDDPFADALESIKGKTVKSRRVAVRRIEPGRELETCQVVFIGSSEGKRLPRVIESLQGLNVLTVGEMDRFVELGGIINFFVQNNRLRFEINVNSAERAGLKLSSQLLSLAKVVRQ